MSWYTYTRMTNVLGVSIQTIKKALRAGGYLDGDSPTVKAFQETVVQWRQPGDPEKYGRPISQFPVWKFQFVEALLAKDPIDDRRPAVTDVISVCRLLQRIATMVWHVPEIVKHKKASLSVAWCANHVIEAASVYAKDGPEASRKLVDLKCKPLVTRCRRADLKERPEIKEVMLMVAQISAWFDNQIAAAKPR